MAGSVPSRRNALLLGALLLAGALAGCAAQAQRDPELVQAVANTRAMSWAPGNYWAYQAVFEEEKTIDVALIVHRVDRMGFHLGSNHSAGFFGLPFTGNVTPSLNPRIGPDEWPLYQFPLEDGKSWSYEMWGYSATTRAEAALIEVPGVGQSPGFRFESAAYGQVFARYDYSPVTGWFTRLELIEPTDGHHVLDVRLTAFGLDYGEAYFVEEPLAFREVACPQVPGELSIDVPAGYLRIKALLTARSDAGVVDARLEDDADRTLAEARAVGKQVVSDRASVGRAQGTWTLHQVCLGKGLVYLEVTGLAPTGPLARPEAPLPTPPPSSGPEVDLVALLQSTLPARPQTGHVTSTGLPVGL